LERWRKETQHETVPPYGYGQVVTVCRIRPLPSPPISNIMAEKETAVTLDEQLKELKRELGIRISYYPRWIDSGKMTFRQAEAQISRQMSAIATLEELKSMKGIELGVNDRIFRIRTETVNL